MPAAWRAGADGEVAEICGVLQRRRSTDGAEFTDVTKSRAGGQRTGYPVLIHTALTLRYSSIC